MAIGTSYCIGLWGLKAYIIQVQAFTSNGLPYFSIIGLPDTSLGEARERVKSACTVTGFSWPQTRVTVNLSPASLPKSGSSFDLAIAASILASSRAIDPSYLADSLLIGELNLDGSIMPVRGILPMLLFAKKSGLRTVYLPEANLAEARLVEGMDLIGLSHIGQFIANCHPNAELSATMGKRFGSLILKGPLAASQEWERVLPFKQRSCPPDFSDSSDALNEDPQVLDFDQVIGQDQAKEALVVAAAGGHHLIMTGPPGAGKTMLAKRLPTILPPLDPQERIEVASIKSLCGTLQANSMDFLPPFEAPHHTASVPSLIGGGNGFAQPGAITRADQPFALQGNDILSRTFPTGDGGEPLPLWLQLGKWGKMHLHSPSEAEILGEIIGTDHGQDRPPYPRRFAQHDHGGNHPPPLGKRRPGGRGRSPLIFPDARPRHRSPRPCLPPFRRLPLVHQRPGAGRMAEGDDPCTLPSYGEFRLAQTRPEHARS